MSNDTSDTLRHTLATLAYRTRQVLKEVPAGYPDFAAGSGVRTPLEILRHMSTVMNYAVHCFRAQQRLELEALSWQQEKDRFETILKRFDHHLELGQEPREGSLRLLLQGPICDAMTHVGQLSTLRRMAGQPVPGENFTQAPVEMGKLEIT